MLYWSTRFPVLIFFYFRHSSKLAWITSRQTRLHRMHLSHRFHLLLISSHDINCSYNTEFIFGALRDIHLNSNTPLKVLVYYTNWPQWVTRLYLRPALLLWILLLREENVRIRVKAGKISTCLESKVRILQLERGHRASLKVGQRTNSGGREPGTSWYYFLHTAFHYECCHSILSKLENHTAYE